LATMWVLLAAANCAPSERHPAAFRSVDELRRTRAQPDALDIDRYLGTEWYGVYVNGNRSGYSISRRERTRCNGKPAYKFSSELAIHLSECCLSVGRSGARIWDLSGGYGDCSCP